MGERESASRGIFQKGERDVLSGHNESGATIILVGMVRISQYPEMYNA